MTQLFEMQILSELLTGPLHQRGDAVPKRVFNAFWEYNYSPFCLLKRQHQQDPHECFMVIRMDESSAKLAPLV